MKFVIHLSINVLTLTYGHELWVVTERKRSRIKAWIGSALGTGEELGHLGRAQRRAATPTH